VDDTLRAVADYEASAGKLARAIEVNTALVEKLPASKTSAEENLTDAARWSRLYSALASVHRRAGHPEQASRFETQGRRLWELWNEKLPGNPFVTRQLAAANPDKPDNR
jgi:hypothetical protein